MTSRKSREEKKKLIKNIDISYLDSEIAVNCDQTEEKNKKNDIYYKAYCMGEF